MTQILTLPGFGGSGPAHWQSLWEARDRSITRVTQDNWMKPDLGDWLRRLDETVSQFNQPIVCVAHSLGCALLAHWVTHCEGRLKGALLVSPTDVDSKTRVSELGRTFGPMPVKRLPFPTIVVASSNDPYVSIDRAVYFAGCWRSEFFNIGERGHINADSQLGDWPEGRGWLRDLCR